MAQVCTHRRPPRLPYVRSIQQQQQYSDNTTADCRDWGFGTNESTSERERSRTLAGSSEGFTLCAYGFVEADTVECYAFERTLGNGRVCCCIIEKLHTYEVCTAASSLLLVTHADNSPQPDARFESELQLYSPARVLFRVKVTVRFATHPARCVDYQSYAEKRKKEFPQLRRSEVAGQLNETLGVSLESFCVKVAHKCLL